MSRRIRFALYALAAVLPPTIAGALGLRELSLRARPALAPALAAGQAALAARPPYDPTRPTVAVLLGADVTENIDALGPYEMFARARRFNVVTVAPERRPTLLSGGLRILPHYSLAELEARLAGRAPAVVIVPNIPNIDRAENRPLVGWMRRQAAAGALMHSWCTGAMALAETGLLDGRTATAHWGDLARLGERYPRVRWVRDVRWVDHGAIVTSGGLTSGIDASLRVLRRLAGDSVARRVARELRYPNYHASIDPRVQPYAVRPADAVLVANAAFRLPRPRIGVALYDGVGEIELSGAYETHAYTAAADVRAVAAAPGLVRSAHGLTLLPALTTASGTDSAAVRALDGLIVPGRDGRTRGAAVPAAVAAISPGLEATYVHADAPHRFALEPLLEELARAVDVPTARFALRRLEYRSDDVRLEGASVPWGALGLPLALGLAGVLLAATTLRGGEALRGRRGAARRGAGRRLGIAAAVLALLLPAGARGQATGAADAPDSGRATDSLAARARVRIDMRTAEGRAGRARLALLPRRRPESVTGTLAAVRGDTVLLVVAPDAEPLRVPRSAIDAVHASRGREPRWRSAARGAIVPALLGGAARGIGTSLRRRDGDPTPARAALSGAVMGAAFAVVKGALFPAERWQRVQLPAAPPSDSALRASGDAHAPGAGGRPRH